MPRYQQLAHQKMSVVPTAFSATATWALWSFGPNLVLDQWSKWVRLLYTSRTSTRKLTHALHA